MNNLTKNTPWTGFMAAAVLALMLAACASQGKPQSATQQLFDHYKEAWNRHDPADIAAAFGQGGTFTTPEFGAQPLAGEGIAGYTQGLFIAIPDFQVKVTRVKQTGDGTLAEEWVASGTWTQPFPAGPLAGKPASGKSFVLPGSGFIEIKDGKIAHATHYYDQLGFLTQIGAIGQ